jgi:hypothetical protein
MIKEVKTTQQMMKLIRIKIKEKKCAIIELLHIGEMVFQSTIEDLPKNFKHDQRYH